jgi:uncharacterized membrane protein
MTQPNHCRRARSRLLILLLVLSWAIVLAAVFHASQAGAERSVDWARFDVDINLLASGQLVVSETQEIDFTEGPFSTGFRNIPLDRVENIENVTVAELINGQPQDYRLTSAIDSAGNPNTYAVQRTASQILIEWSFQPTTNASRTFVIRYHVDGAVRNYPEETPPNQQIWWVAVSDEITETAPVRSSTTSIHLPTVVDPNDVIAGTENLPIEPVQSDPQTWVWHASDLKSGDDLTVRLQFPSLVDISTPSWQERDDQQREDKADTEERNQLWNLAFLTMGGLGALAGGIALYGLWYAKGRDPHTGPIASFLAEPPDELPPGAVGVLSDEIADQRDVVATMLDLARRGVIKLDEEREEGFFGGTDYKITLLTMPDNLRPFETSLLGSLFGSDLKPGEVTKLGVVKSRFDSASDTIKSQLYDEIMARKYFVDPPESVRGRYRKASYILLSLTAVLGFYAIGKFSSGGPWVWLPVIVALALGITLFVLSSKMPQKTRAGAEAAAKWNAFRQYLNDIEKYDRIADHKLIFDKYLPYAVAYGLEQSWVNKFASAGAPAPDWYGPFDGDAGVPGRPYRRYRGGRGPVIVWSGGGPGGDGDHGSSGGDFDLPDLPDLQEMSDRGARSLSNTSDSLFDMISTAASIFGSFTGSSGGRHGRGFGGGGGFGGGFGGGGGGGGGSGGGSGGFR